MNKQEAIERIKNLYSFIIEDGPFEVDLINKNQVLEIISKIDERHKVVVPMLKSELVTKIRGGRIWVERTVMTEAENDTEV